MTQLSSKLFALGLIAASFSSFSANAGNTNDYFLGFDLGARISGQMDTYDSEFGSNKQDLRASLVYGVRGGAIVNNTHKFSIGYDHGRLIYEHNNPDDADINTVFGKYDYIVPISKNLGWTIGGKLGYEMFSDNDGNYKELNGIVVGAQTGLTYRLADDLSVGTEFSYLHHTREFEVNNEYGSASMKLDDETLIMTNVEYHF
ncbi:outer membrane beta-barrel protein [Vibrio salilacus]|uniref:outer membrane beta-barrel protein n=1 Tax=Vibrio salilacus TaxID=1323749 RepID=UPI000C2B15DF|nr:outer membrane beta-barrel protein [Vibrio salilacus]